MQQGVPLQVNEDKERYDNKLTFAIELFLIIPEKTHHEKFLSQLIGETRPKRLQSVWKKY
jgi:hypothetical protein